MIRRAFVAMIVKTAFITSCSAPYTQGAILTLTDWNLNTLLFGDDTLINNDNHLVVRAVHVFIKDSGGFN